MAPNFENLMGSENSVEHIMMLLNFWVSGKLFLSYDNKKNTSRNIIFFSIIVSQKLFIDTVLIIVKSKRIFKECNANR